MYGSSQYGSAVYGPKEKVLDAVDYSEILPKEAKDAIRDFIHESFDHLWSNLEDLLELPTPDNLIKYWDQFIEIIQNLLS